MNRIKLAGAIAFAFLSATANIISAQECTTAGTVGTGGSAAAGSTSASSAGTAGVCQSDSGTTSSIGSAGSAAAVDGNATSKTPVNDNSENLKAQTKAQAVDQGTFSKSKTKTSTDGNSLQSTTRTMSHVPGQKPAKGTTEQNVILPQQ